MNSPSNPTTGLYLLQGKVQGWRSWITNICDTPQAPKCTLAGHGCWASPVWSNLGLGSSAANLYSRHISQSSGEASPDKQGLSEQHQMLASRIAMKEKEMLESCWGQWRSSKQKQLSEAPRGLGSSGANDVHEGGWKRF
ncbi:zinc finger protein 536 [Lates japonicus]|uniref:Zinc finger protein 536 n=1 Tax=Lates japonicus TaxID=270547 RepID=A0AAD3NIA3_LATJO|nr:zinc finger protein 536 [Lates japonicus]